MRLYSIALPKYHAHLSLHDWVLIVNVGISTSVLKLADGNLDAPRPMHKKEQDTECYQAPTGGPREEACKTKRSKQSSVVSGIEANAGVAGTNI